MGKKVHRKWKRRAEDRADVINKIAGLKENDVVKVRSTHGSCPVYVKYAGKDDCGNTGDTVAAKGEDSLKLCEAAKRALKLQLLENEKNMIPTEDVRVVLDKVFAKYFKLVDSYNRVTRQLQKCQDSYDATHEKLTSCSHEHLNTAQMYKKFVKSTLDEKESDESLKKLKREEYQSLYRRVSRQRHRIVILLCVFILLVLVCVLKWFKLI